jgi:hypothetical protein
MVVANGYCLLVTNTYMRINDLIELFHLGPKGGTRREHHVQVLLDGKEGVLLNCACGLNKPPYLLAAYALSNELH